MKRVFRLAAGVVAFAGGIATANAAAIITGIQASGEGLGSFSNIALDNEDRLLTISKAFDSVNPITLTFTVGHDTGPGNPFSVSELITNESGVTWFDYHYSIVEPDANNGVVFTAHNQSTLNGFVLQDSSGPRNLDFAEGSLANGATTAVFNLSLPDPGQGDTYTFSLVQTPTIPEPSTYALMAAGLLVIGAIARRRI